MFILSSIFSGLEFWSVKHTSVYENSELNIFKNINFFGKDSWILLIIVLKIWQCINTPSVTSEWGQISQLLSLFISLLVLPSNFIVSGVKSSR